MNFNNLLTFTSLTWWQITIIAVVCSIVGFYLLTFIISLCFVLSFKRKMKAKYKAICLQINQRYTLLTKIEEYFKEKKLKLPKEYLSLINSLRELDTSNIDESKRLDYLKTLNDAKAHLVFYVEQLDKYYNDKNYLAFKESYLKSEDEYRRLVASYNLDVNGYNYWIRGFLFRYLFKMLRFKKKETIR